MRDGLTPLMRAACDGDLARVRKRIRAGDDVNARSGESGTVHALPTTTFTIPDAGYTALMFAAFGADLPVMRALLDAGARVDLEAESHATALTQAVNSGDARAVKLLLAHGADPNQKAGFTALHEASGEDGSVELVRLLLAKGANVDQRIWTGGTALMNASHYGRDAIVGLLLARGARVDVRDRSKNTALHEACDVLLVSGARKDPRPIVKRLLAHGANANAKNDEGRTPLHLAAAEHRAFPELAEALLRAGAKPNTKDQEGKTPLHYASELDGLDMVIALLDGGANIEARDREGMTALLNAARNGYVDLGIELLRRGAKRSPRAVSLARKFGRTDFNRMLRGELVAAEQLPRAVFALCTDAEARFKRGDYAGTVVRYRRIPHEALVRIPSATSNLAQALQRTRKHADAVTWFERAIAIHEKPAHLWKALCFSHYKLSRWTDMERAATMAARLAPKDDYVWQQLAIARSEQKNFRGAIAAGERAIKLSSRNAYARFNLAADRKKAGERNTLPEFRKAIALDGSLAKFLDADDARALRRR